MTCEAARLRADVRTRARVSLSLPAATPERDAVEADLLVLAHVRVARDHVDERVGVVDVLRLGLEQELLRLVPLAEVHLAHGEAVEEAQRGLELSDELLERGLRVALLLARVGGVATHHRV